MSIRIVLLHLFSGLLLATFVTPLPAEAQVWKRVKKKAKEKVEQRAEQKTDAAMEAALDGFEDAVVCVVTDEECIEAAQEDGKVVVTTDEEDGELIRDENGEIVTDPDVARAQATGTEATLAPGEGTWANYDFVPGSRVLFYDDYGSEYIGDFPRRLQFHRGTIELVEWEGGRAVRGKTKGAFNVPLPEILPEKFTVEFDFYAGDFVNDIQVHVVDAGGERAGVQYVGVDPYEGVGVVSYARGGIESKQPQRRLGEEMLPIRIAVDGSYVKVYVAEERVANVPNADLGRTDRLQFVLRDVRKQGVFIGPIRVAEGGRTRIYQELSAAGRFATRGILFDTGSERLRPESTPTLEEIGRMMEQHVGLRLRVEGHTDNVGAADVNQTLSAERAQAVVDYLTGEKNVAADRLEAVGLGAAEPAADNATPEGRQTNRRVELVVL